MTGVRSTDAMQPLAFAILAGLTPANVETVLIDERLEPIRYDDPGDLVAISVETYTARNAYQIAGRFRRRNVPVVLGGCHPTFVPKEALAFADAVVLGDAEGLWQQVVRDARAGRLQRVYQQPEPPPVDGLRRDRSIFQGKRYASVIPVQFGRGCRFACDFCSIHALYGRRLRQRPVEEVVTEIEELGCKHAFFVDDNLFVDTAQAERLLRALVPLRVTWSCQVSIDVTRNMRLLNLMAESGCHAAVIGFESFDERNLAQMKKPWNNKPEGYATAVRKLQDCGIMIYGTFVFGYDYDTVDSFDVALDFALHSNFFLANFNPLTPTPGTPLYHRLRAGGQLIYDPWWLAPDYRYGQAIFHPRKMTAGQLTEGCYRARLAFNRYGSIFRRALDWKSNCQNPYRLGIYLLANLISRREILRKQGLPLGDGTPLEPIVETETQPQVDLAGQGP
jgi:radical SAM superfamily enzyme YgiQ (UPF0313 family)